MDGIHGYIQAPAGFLKTPEWFWLNVLWVLIQRSVSRVTASGLGLASFSCACVHACACVCNLVMTL